MFGNDHCQEGVAFSQCQEELRNICMGKNRLLWTTIGRSWHHVRFTYKPSKSANIRCSPIFLYFHVPLFCNVLCSFLSKFQCRKISSLGEFLCTKLRTKKKNWKLQRKSIFVCISGMIRQLLPPRPSFSIVIHAQRDGLNISNGVFQFIPKHAKNETIENF